MATKVQAIVEELERRIVSGVYQADTQLPTEPELAQAFGASVTTIRGAVSELQARGFVTKQQGRGTYVRTNGHVSLNMMLEMNLSVSSVIEAAGYTPGIIDLTVSREMPPPAIARELSLAPQTECVVVRRTRTADRMPAASSTDYVVDYPGLPTDTHSYENSLYSLLGTVYGQPVASGTARIEAKVARADVAERLDIPEWSPVLFLSQVHELGDGTPVMYSIVSLRTDVVNLYMHRGINSS